MFVVPVVMAALLLPCVVGDGPPTQTSEPSGNRAFVPHSTELGVRHAEAVPTALCDWTVPYYTTPESKLHNALKSSRLQTEGLPSPAPKLAMPLRGFSFTSSGPNVEFKESSHK